MSSVLSLAGLEKSFGNTKAVAGLSLDVAPGEIVGLIGPDGSGKTTTMRLVAGLLRPDQGSVQVLGHDVATETRTIHSLVGYMPQQYSLYGDLTVQENLRFFAGIYGVPDGEMLAREKRLLGIARLEEFRDRPAQALSGGMYKKLALSCAMVHEPHLLLLDEPTNGVDPISRRELWELLKERVRAGIGVLISTPYMDEAERCDRVVLLVEGRAVALDKPAALKAAFAAKILEITTQIPMSSLAPLAAAQGVDQAYTVGRKIHAVTRDATRARAEIEKALAAEHVALVSLNEVPPSFEDIFLDLSTRRQERA